MTTQTLFNTLLTVEEYCNLSGLSNAQVFRQLENGMVAAVMAGDLTASDETSLGYDYVLLPPEGVRRVITWTGEADYLGWTYCGGLCKAKAYCPNVNNIRILLVPGDFPGDSAEASEPPGSHGIKKKPSGDEEWKKRARERAQEIILRDRTKDLYPDQLAIADEIARDFRKILVMGADAKPLKGTYIKRHAMKGISSAQGKQLSTSIRRGK
jgi:hypothetical protein